MSASTYLPIPSLSELYPNLHEPFDASRWRRYFQQNLDTPIDIPWATSSTLSETEKTKLAETLSVFQLGESGEGRVLFRFAESLRNDPRFHGYESALRLFVDEEKRHSQLLADLVIRRFEGKLRAKQWSDSLFRFARHLINLKFELQILLTAELIADGYYGLIYRRVEDPVVHTICRKIVRDEVQHIRFHAHFFGARMQSWPGVIRRIWTWQFRAVAFVMSRLVWLSHRAQLVPFGIRKADFYRRVRSATRRFLRGARLKA